MKRIRVIPTLLLEGGKLVKTIQFKGARYVGDPINAVRIFNEKEVDEICILDINATKTNSTPDLDYIKILASECFMPLSYGGGVNTLQQANEIFKAGVEKVVLGTAAVNNPSLVEQIANMAGSQSVVVSIDFKKDWRGRTCIYTNCGSKKKVINPIAYARQIEAMGAGEILLQSIAKEGTLKGYDLEVVQAVASSVNIPVIASGGASSIEDFLRASQAGASAVAAGYIFVYKGSNKAVLINYPNKKLLKENLYNKL